MFQPASETLKQREGTLDAVPLPLLLNAIHREERTCVLALKQQNLEKRIMFEEGAPVGCTSNLLHETLGNFLVAKGKLTSEQAQGALLESAQTGTRLGELLIQRGLVTPFDLYKSMQANLAHKILDAFRWSDAQYRLDDSQDTTDSPVRMNTAQLVLTGVANFLPFEALAAHLVFTDEQRFVQTERPPLDVTALKLSPKEAKLLSLLKGGLVFRDLVSKSGMDTEEVLRRLYAYSVLGIVQLTSGPTPRMSDPAPTSAQTSSPAPPPSPRPPGPAAQEQAAQAIGGGLGLALGDDALRDELMRTFMVHRSKDPFTLLGVSEETSVSGLRRAFVDLANRFSPLRFEAEAREKAEELLCAHARAFTLLVDPEQNALWKQRRASAAKARPETTRPSTAEQMRIETKLLDASSQFDEGRKCLARGDARGALLQFEHVCAIEEKPRHLAYLAWSRYLVNPSTNAKLALQSLALALRRDAACEEAHFFSGEIHRAQGSFAEAEESFRRAFKANPKNRRALELAQDMGQRKR